VIGESAHNILKASAPFTPSGVSFKNTIFMKDRESLQLGPFEIRPYLVDHSAYDAYALLISAGGKRLFYSGDFRAHGHKAKVFQKLIAYPPNDIYVLLMEGTTIGRAKAEQKFQSEDDLTNEFVDTFQATKGL
jgi:ribonuclease J